MDTFKSNETKKKQQQQIIKHFENKVYNKNKNGRT